MAQTYQDAPSTERVRESRPKFLARDEALRSAFSGTTFPTDPAPVDGQVCYRTDEKRLYRRIAGAWRVENTTAPAENATALRAIDAAAAIADGAFILVLGLTTRGDTAPFWCVWDADSSATHDGLSVFRPTVGDAATGVGRWLRASGSSIAGAAPVASLTALRSATWNGQAPDVVIARTNWAANDGGGIFTRVGSGTDDGGVTIVDGDSLIWRRMDNGPPLDSWFETLAAALTYVGTSMPLTITRTHTLTGNLTVSAALIFRPITGQFAGAFTLTLNGDVICEAGDYSRKFADATTVVMGGRNRAGFSTWFGGSSSDWGPGITKAFASGVDEVTLPPVAGTIATTVTVPHTRPNLIVWGSAPVTVAANLLPAFSFRRPATANTGTQLIIDQGGFIWSGAGLAKNSDLVDFRGSALTAGVSITRSGTTATVSHTAHGKATGDKVLIIGCDQAEYNGLKTITVVNANSYTFTVSGSPATPATGSIAIAPNESSVFHDNRLIMRNGEARGLRRVVVSMYCRVEFYNYDARFNSIPWEPLRDSSFCVIRDCLWANNLSAIYGIDPVPNGLSNGITLDRFFAVGNGGAGSFDDITLLGWQAVTWKSGSVDLSTAGAACIRLDRCDDMDLNLEWLASDKVASASHEAAILAACPRGSFRVNSLVNHGKGVTVTTTASDGYVYNVHGHPNIEIESSLGVTNATLNYVFATGFRVSVKRILTAAARTNGNYEFWATGAAAYITHEPCQMIGPSYTITDNITGQASAGFSAQWLP